MYTDYRLSPVNLESCFPSTMAQHIHNIWQLSDVFVVSLSKILPWGTQQKVATQKVSLFWKVCLACLEIILKYKCVLLCKVLEKTYFQQYNCSNNSAVSNFYQHRADIYWEANRSYFISINCCVTSPLTRPLAWWKSDIHWLFCNNGKPESLVADLALLLAMPLLTFLTVARQLQHFAPN